MPFTFLLHILFSSFAFVRNNNSVIKNTGNSQPHFFSGFLLLFRKLNCCLFNFQVRAAGHRSAVHQSHCIDADTQVAWHRIPQSNKGSLFHLYLTHDLEKCKCYIYSNLRVCSVIQYAQSRFFSSFSSFYCRFFYPQQIKVM